MYAIDVSYKNKDIKIICDNPGGERLSDILIKNNIFVNNACGGNGTCGGCAVEICDGESFRRVLSCRYYPKGDIKVRIPETSRETSYMASSVKKTACRLPNPAPNAEGSVAAAADIGSTSVSICLNVDGVFADGATFPNPTIPYGADVISRIRASMSGKKDVMAGLLRKGIDDALMLLLKRNDINPKKLSRFVISCNNTMQHILLGLDCAPLSAYPFKSENTVFKPVPYGSIFDNGGCAATVHIIRSFSAFIGGDILSGLYSLMPLPRDKAFLFLDLGTNAEMAAGHKSRVICASAAAGPAFEAGGLSCGCACVPGAINDVAINKSASGKFKIKYTTIDGRLPVGICGSGVLKLISQMLDNGIIDSYGTLADQYAESGFPIARSPRKTISVSQNDIRQIQLAISAIKTGIRILLKEASLSASDICDVYISGSFGASLDFHSIKNLNILRPEWLKDPRTVKAAANTSLNGAVKYITDADAGKTIDGIASRLEEVLLAENDSFNASFIDNINFT